MGLTNSSIGMRAVDSGLEIKKQSPSDYVIALAGNPNVGKSTVFNGLTGMNQHTGNWPGKTVSNAQGYCTTKDNSYVFVDIPGTYSLMAHSAEEEVARNFICFGDPDVVIVVCDATCLERNLNLVLQTMELSSRVIVCVNLMDEAKRKGIQIDFEKLSERLGVPVVPTIARKKKSLDELMLCVDKIVAHEEEFAFSLRYPQQIEEAISIINEVIHPRLTNKLNSRWVSLRLLDQDQSLVEELKLYLGEDFLQDEEIISAIREAKLHLVDHSILQDELKDKLVSSIICSAEEMCEGVITYCKDCYDIMDRKFDKILTSKLMGYPIMLLLLAFIFWLTITGANYPSRMLAIFLFWIQDKLTELFIFIGAPSWLQGVLIDGVYRVLAWVVSVMLPPMAIFFPLFTLLEDSGYLPRVAYNLDKPFKRCQACGKQALTMCMGFGCNAAGVVGCRIIDSPRERLLAIITNNFVPCNGRFPTLIAILTMFFVGSSVGGLTSVLSALLLTCVILVGVFITFGVTSILSKTILKGIPSSYTLELPPYRKPQFGKVIVRSIYDRTLFVLGRALIVAAPAGMVIWLLANIMIGDVSMLAHCTEFLDPFARLLGLDGVILIAFILGFPANEIVIPIIIMTYLAEGSLLEMDNIFEMKSLFVQNGWTWITAMCTMLFSLIHWPCSTTVLTIKKETGSLRWTAVSVFVPTVIGIIICMIFANIAKLFL